ncbi:MAG TPA: GDSL-type esterase/lipase family protein [Verrucomicrobiae bacterium]|jgi:lysophospholipase L1-like esterase
MNASIRKALAITMLFAALPLAQGAETKHNFAQWEKEISAYERSDATNPPAKGSYVFIGSSTIRKWKTLATDFPGEPVVNRGFGGSEIIDSVHFAPRILFPYAPKKVFFRAGGNDLWAGVPVGEVYSNFMQFAELTHAQLPDTKIYFIGWSPSVQRWKQHDKEEKLDALVAAYITGKPYLQYIKTDDLPMGTNGLPRKELFVADGLHFSPAGYKLLAARVRPYVMEN